MKQLSIYRFMALLVTVTLLFVTCTKEESDVRLGSQLSSSQILDLKSDSATIVGFVVAAGGTITEKGVVYSTTTNPTIDNTKVLYTDDIGQATFHVTLTGLNYATKYYAKAYIINENGTFYGEEIEFTTLPVVPTLLTTDISAITGNSAAGGGSITVNGGAEITERGIVWSTSHNPTIDDAKSSDGTDMGEFTSALSGLKGLTTYYVRAYATNSAGTGYGPEVSFTTLADWPATLYMIGDGVGDWSWDNTDLPMVPVNGQPHLFWKIVWLKSSGTFKFAPGKAWSNDFGKTGDPEDGVYNKGSENIPVTGTAGYYMVVVDLDKNKIAITDPNVYLTGNTVGSWGNADAANLFTVDNANEVLTITKTLEADNLRMFVHHPWITDWWRAEFNIISDKIEFRGTGGDQTAVPVTAGSKTINLNFKTGAGSIL